MINVILDGKGNLFEDRRKNNKEVKKDRRKSEETVKTETKRKCSKSKNK